jgi:hypothetical protein
MYPALGGVRQPRVGQESRVRRATEHEHRPSGRVPARLDTQHTAVSRRDGGRLGLHGRDGTAAARSLAEDVCRLRSGAFARTDGFGETLGS